MVCGGSCAGAGPQTPQQVTFLGSHRGDLGSTQPAWQRQVIHNWFQTFTQELGVRCLPSSFVNLGGLTEAGSEAVVQPGPGRRGCSLGPRQP